MMTPQQWKDTENKLKSFFNIVKLNCDGYELSLVLERYNQFKNVIAIYVDGVSKGTWVTTDCEERRRFLCPITRSLMSAKQKQALKKLSKKIRTELEMHSTYTYHTPYWTSFSALNKHLIKQNKMIELIQETDGGKS